MAMEYTAEELLWLIRSESIRIADAIMAQRFPTEVSISADDLERIVNAVQALKGPATADEIALAVREQIAPPVPPGTVEPVSEAVVEMRKAMERLSQVIGGLARQYGGAGPTTTTLSGPITATVTGVATEDTLLKLERGLTDYESRLDYDTRVDGNPVYVGKNLNGTATSATNWVIQKLTYDVTNRLTRAQVLSGSWDGRAGLGW